ncbi:MAG: TIGR03032 family protein [Xanthomonadales bacterium]|nr:TIGR03032 family protein [Xanthomonadales bacterium]
MNATGPRLEITASRQFTSWLADCGGSLCFSTYQAGKLFFIGLKPDGALSLFERTFARIMGVSATADTLWAGTLYQLWKFENLLQPGENHQGYDRLYVPRLAYTTGDLDIHDVAMDGDDQPVFVNTLFSCLSRPSDQYSFVPEWKPPFISKLAAEDRCHLNGLAMRDGQPAFVTCVSKSDVNEGWREHRTNGGLVLSVPDGEVVCDGLSMPHSPRWYQGRLWVLNSGKGEFGYVDSGEFHPVSFSPGYLRGLCFIGDYAVLGLSKPREKSTFDGLDLQDKLAASNASARCAIQVVDLKRGDIVHELRIEGVVEELYDVAFIPGCRQPMALGFKTDEIRRVLSLPPDTAHPM